MQSPLINPSNSVVKTTSINTIDNIGAVAPILQGVMESQGLHNPGPEIEARNQGAAITTGQLARARKIYRVAPTLANRDLLITTLGKELTIQRAQLADVQAQLEKYQADKEREAKTQRSRQGWGEWAISGLKNFFGSTADQQLEKYQGAVADAQKEIAKLEAEQNDLAGILPKSWMDDVSIFEEQSVTSKEENIAAATQSHSRRLLQQSGSAEFRVNTYTAGGQFGPRVSNL